MIQQLYHINFSLKENGNCCELEDLTEPVFTQNEAFTELRNSEKPRHYQPKIH